jgi:hypothetical protein
VTGSPELVAAVRTTKQFLTYVTSGPFQYAIAEALRRPDDYFTAFRDALQAKRDLPNDAAWSPSPTPSSATTPTPVAPRSASPSARNKTSSGKRQPASTDSRSPL